MFDCGISIITKEMQTQFDNDCLTVVQEYGFNIDKDQLQKAITDSRSFYDEGYLDAKRMFERPQGEWQEWIDERWGGATIYCPYCKENALENNRNGGYRQVRSNFCPNCGAKMEVKKNEIH